MAPRDPSGSAWMCMAMSSRIGVVHSAGLCWLSRGDLVLVHHAVRVGMGGVAAPGAIRSVWSPQQPTGKVQDPISCTYSLGGKRCLVPRRA